MRPITDINDLHGILLGIGKEFHRICTENDTPYYMLGGTMLGAVRHKGFIPWDDDMDFGVPREHYEKLKQVLAKQLAPTYKVLTIENSDALCFDFIKISDERTVMNEIFKENAKDKFGVNIDIFPLDRSVNKKGVAKLVSVIKMVSQYVWLSTKQRPLHKKVVAFTLKILLFWCNKIVVRNFINKHLLSDKGDYVSNIYGAWGDKETVKENIMGIPRLYKFENVEFYGVAHPELYLKSLYNDYMQLPPEDKRHIHITGAFWKD